MEFFQKLSELLNNCNLSISIERQSSERFIVAIQPYNETFAIGNNTTIIPLCLEGTPLELDEGLIDAIKKPISRIESLLSNESQVDAALDSAVKQSLDRAKKIDSAKKTIDAHMAPSETIPIKEDKKKTYDDAIIEIERLNGMMKYADALLLVPAIDRYPDKAKELKKLREDLTNKLRQYQMFTT